MINLRVEKMMLDRIKNNDHEGVFDGGACFVFALRLHQLHNYKIRGIRTASVCHTWVLTGTNVAVDIRGAHPEALTIAMATDTMISPQDPPTDWSPDQLNKEITAKGYSVALTEQLHVLAERIFETHVRYEKVRPPKASC